MPKLSVIIPAYNEAKRISRTLKSINAFLAHQPYEYEILVVDDGSKDNTVEVVENLSKEIKNLRVVENKENHGKGWVTKQGMLEAKGDIRLFTDADNSTTVDQVAKFLPYFDRGFHVVIGSRRIEGSVITVKQGPIRDFLGWAFRTVVHTIVPLGVTDSQCGFKAFSAKAAKALFTKQTIFRWAFDVEILSLAKKAKYKIQEVPIIWTNDEESHVKLSGEIKMLLEVMTIRWNLWTGKYK